MNEHANGCLPAASLLPSCCMWWAVAAANGFGVPVASCKLQVAAMRKVAIKTRTASTERAH